MRTETVTYNIYQYHELSDDAKQKVKDWYLNDHCRVYMFEEDIMTNLESLFGNAHNMNVQFSLGYCQGDGVNIYGSVSAWEVVDFLKNNKWFANPLSDDEMKTILLYAKDTDGIGLPHNRHYCYCMADSIEFTDEWKEQLEWAIEKGYAAVNSINIELINKFNEVVVDIFNCLCEEYETYGYEFFYEINDDEMQELCEINEWEFYEDGTFW